LGGLDVVVPVDERGRRARRTQPFAVDHWMSGGGNHLGARESDLAQVVGEVLRTPHAILAVLGLRADARNAEAGRQVFDESVAMLLEVLGDGIHAGAPMKGAHPRSSF